MESGHQKKWIDNENIWLLPLSVLTITSRSVPQPPMNLGPQCLLSVPKQKKARCLQTKTCGWRNLRTIDKGNHGYGTHGMGVPIKGIVFEKWVEWMNEFILLTLQSGLLMYVSIPTFCTTLSLYNPVAVSSQGDEKYTQDRRLIIVLRLENEHFDLAQCPMVSWSIYCLCRRTLTNLAEWKWKW